MNLQGYKTIEVIDMDYKKILAITLGGSALGSALAGKKGLETGLGLGIKVGVGTGVAGVIAANQVYKLGKRKLRKKSIEA